MRGVVQTIYQRPGAPVLCCAMGALFVVAGVLVSGGVDLSDALDKVGGLMMIIAAVVYVLRSIGQPQAELWSEGYEAGDSAGYRRGRREGKPVIVPLSTRCHCQHDEIPSPEAAAQ